MKGIIVEKDGTIRLADDIPMPEPGPYEALVKIESCMICNGTDMEIIRGELPEAQVFPTVLGHESAGRVVKIGEKASEYIAIIGFALILLVFVIAAHCIFKRKKK